MFGAPYTGLLTLGFLAVVVSLMALDYPVGTYTVASLLLIIPALVVGWLVMRERIHMLAAEQGEDRGGFDLA